MKNDYKNYDEYLTDPGHKPMHQGMASLVNPKPHFIHWDVVRIKETGELAIVDDVSANSGQYQDKHQWSYSLTVLDQTSDSRHAWYDADDLELVNNIFEIMCKRTAFGTSPYRTKMDALRRV